MEKFSAWFSRIICPWNNYDELAIAAIVAVILITLSTITIFILIKRYDLSTNHDTNNKKLYLAIIYFCTPLIFFALSLLFKWYIAIPIFTLVFVLAFSSSNNDELATKKSFIIFYLVNIILPYFLLMILSFLGLPYLFLSMSDL